MTLTSRLTLLLLAAFAGLSALLLHQSLTTADRYFQHVTQDLSAPIAMYIAENRAPFRDGVFDPARFRELADTAMILNPSIEVYALDSAGRILAHADNARPLARIRVDLAPLRAFIAGAGEQRPLVGDDPRDVVSRRIFSAAPVGPPASPWGYVYVILDSSARQEITARTWPHHVPAFAGGGIAVVVLAGFIVAALLFGRLALPLRTLAREVAAFEEQVTGDRDARRGSRDEIAGLRLGFERLRSRITAQMRTLQAADTSRREWIAHLSHDLRTPLSTLQAHLETVLKREGVASASERREGIARALMHCTQVRRLLAELFESARLEAPSLELHPENFSLAELVHDAVLGFREAADAQSVRIECEMDAAELTVRGDIGLFQRLIDNLLTNAVKASPRGSVVSVGVRRLGNVVTLTVGDKGAGPTADMLRVFAHGQEPAIGASGLGLRIVAQILRLHGLRSRVESAVGGGALVRIDVVAANDPARGESIALEAGAIPESPRYP